MFTWLPICDPMIDTGGGVAGGFGPTTYKTPDQGVLTNENEQTKTPDQGVHAQTKQHAVMYYYLFLLLQLQLDAGALSLWVVARPEALLRSQSRAATNPA